ncbi:MAG: hypothetical protein RBR06_02415 [Desulfuromonadaceae bacterium]|nr:hypothetical protein [Desulfuromonadaceae bacterium]
MPNKQNLKKENYLGFFLLLATLMAFAVIVKSCNVAGYQAEQAEQQRSGLLEIDQRC